jgi:hypothetical protein
VLLLRSLTDLVVLHPRQHKVLIGVLAYLCTGACWANVCKAKLRSVHVGLGLSTFTAGLATMAVSGNRIIHFLRRLQTVMFATNS